MQRRAVATDPSLPSKASRYCCTISGILHMTKPLGAYSRLPGTQEGARPLLDYSQWIGKSFPVWFCLHDRSEDNEAFNQTPEFVARSERD